MKLPKKKYLGQFVKVTFDDHYVATDADDDDMECWTVGKIINIGPRKIRLRNWHAKGYPDGSSNHEFVVIVRSTIKKIRILK